MGRDDEVEGQEVVGYEVVISRRVQGWRKRKEWNKKHDSDWGISMPRAETEQYEYVTAILPFNETQEVYKQKVEELDVARIIAAVNGFAIPYKQIDEQLGRRASEQC